MVSKSTLQNRMGSVKVHCLSEIFCLHCISSNYWITSFQGWLWSVCPSVNIGFVEIFSSPWYWTPWYWYWPQKLPIIRALIVLRLLGAEIQIWLHSCRTWFLDWLLEVFVSFWSLMFEEIMTEQCSGKMTDFLDKRKLLGIPWFHSTFTAPKIKQSNSWFKIFLFHESQIVATLVLNISAPNLVV